MPVRAEGAALVAGRIAIALVTVTNSKAERGRMSKFRVTMTRAAFLVAVTTAKMGLATI